MTPPPNSLTGPSPISSGQIQAEPSVEAAPQTSTSAHEERDWLARLGFPPLGSFLYATAVAEFGLTFGAWPGTGGFGTGFHYAERGGLFAQWLLAILGTMGNAQQAQERANRTGETQYYEVYRPSDFSGTALTIDTFSSQLGGNVSGASVDLFKAFKFAEQSRLPWMLDLGLHVHFYDGPDDTMDQHEIGGLGLVLGALFPITRWGQGQVIWRPSLPMGEAPHKSWFTLEGAATANIGNRLYGRVAVMYSSSGDTGTTFGVGGRL